MKGLKKIGTLACVGATVLSMTAPVMAANDTTNVSYTPGSFSVDNDGKVLMVVPKDVNFTAGVYAAERELMIKTSDSTQKLPKNFSVDVKVNSTNKGKLTAASIQEKITYTMKQGENTNSLTNVDLATVSKVHTFADVAGASNSLKRVIKFEATQNEAEEVEKKYGAEKTFTDTLTFSVENLKGDGLTAK